jgi:glycosyltransferase involved in cell wall biosynthesis
MRLLCITSHRDTLNSIRPEAELFIGLQRAGVEVTVMTQGDSAYADPMREAGIEVVDFVPRRKLSLEAMRRIRRELRSRRIEVVYAFNNKAIANTNLAALGLPVKVVTYRGQTGNIHRWDPSAYLTHLNPRVDLILCVADAVRDSLRAQHPHPARVRTVYKGHSLDWYREPPADLAEFAIPAGAFTVICVANNRPRKGLGVLVEATYRLPREADIHLLLVGGGLEEPELARLIGASPMRERIHVAGFRRDATALVAACSASVLPSLKREGLPKTVIESMAYAVPPIVTDTGGSAELVIDGQSGRVVPPGDAAAIADAIRFLYENPTERALMGRRARERLDRHFNVAETVSRTKQLLEELLEQRG